MTQPDLSELRVALVHDYLVQHGGAEQVFEVLAEVFPRADIFTLLYNKKNLSPSLRKTLSSRSVKTSYLQKIPLATRYYRSVFWLMPYAIEQLDLSGYDLIISDTTSFAKGVIVPPNTPHLCYCHTPTRFLWDRSQAYFRYANLPRSFKLLASPVLHYLRIWDWQAAQRPSMMIANSRFVAQRINKYYGREARVVYPPLNQRSSPQGLQGHDNYYLIVSRLVYHKGIDVAVKACQRLGRRLVVVGDGPLRKRLRSLASSRDIEFTGSRYGEDLNKLYLRARAFIFPAEEDFGLAPVEAMRMGRPVIALNYGGIKEYLQESRNGIFFDEQSVESLAKAIERFELIESTFRADGIKKSIEKFDKKFFIDAIKNLSWSLLSTGKS